MRARALLVAVILTTLVVGVVAVAAVRDGIGTDAPATLVRADVSGLGRGDVLPVAVDLPAAARPPRHDGGRARVLFVRQGGRIDAYLGVSTHLGCALRVPGDPTYGEGFQEIAGEPRIEDPCGGATYAFDGRCVGGPCPRDLDRYTVRRSGSTAQIDLNRLVAGAART